MFWPVDLVQQLGTLVGWKVSDKTFVLCSCLSVGFLFFSLEGQGAHLIPCNGAVSNRSGNGESSVQTWAADLMKI